MVIAGDIGTIIASSNEGHQNNTVKSLLEFLIEDDWIRLAECKYAILFDVEKFFTNYFLEKNSRNSTTKTNAIDTLHFQSLTSFERFFELKENVIFFIKIQFFLGEIWLKSKS